jgi:hypothetical protein
MLLLGIFVPANHWGRPCAGNASHCDGCTLGSWKCHWWWSNVLRDGLFSGLLFVQKGLLDNMPAQDVVVGNQD